MYFALDCEGNRIYIDDAIDGEKYFCPICGQELLQRKGSIKQFHFAHKVGYDEECDSWHYDMSDWHRDWQQQFPLENREVVIETQGKKHRADVLINGIVIEFQHSRISVDEFEERNQFYTAAGYRVVWLFDFVEEYDEGKIEQSNKEWQYKWNYHWHTFDKINLKDDKIKLFIQMAEDLSQDGYCGIEHIVWFSPDGRIFITESNEAYNLDEFIELFIPKPEKAAETNELSIADVYDQLIEVKNVYYPCPINNFGGECYENCDCCQYSIQCVNKDAIGIKNKELYTGQCSNIQADYTSGCLYRFADVLNGWDLENDKVLQIQKDFEGRVLSLTIEKNGNRIEKEYSSIKRTGKTLVQLLSESSSKVIIAKNIRSGVEVKISNSNYFKCGRVSRVRGCLKKKNGKGFYDEWRDIYSWDQPEWIITWEAQILLL